MRRDWIIYITISRDYFRSLDWVPTRKQAVTMPTWEAARGSVRFLGSFFVGFVFMRAKLPPYEDGNKTARNISRVSFLGNWTWNPKMGSPRKAILERNLGWVLVPNSSRSIAPVALQWQGEGPRNSVGQE